MKRYIPEIILIFIYAFNINHAVAVETNLSPDMYEYLMSDKTSGPTGSLYESFGTNFIFKRSSYNNDTNDFIYDYSKRLALPTRLILPVENNESCLSCHRLDYPAIAGGEDIPLTKILNEGISVTSLTFDSADDILPVWSTENDIFWLSDRSGSYQLWVMDSMGNNKRQLTNENGDVVYYDVSKNGNSVVYSTYDETSPSFNIKVLDLNSDTAIEIISSENIIDRPELSPDEKWIAYSQKNDNNWDIFVISSEGGSPIRLTTSENMDTNPQWSPDGTIIAYKTAPVSGDYNLTTQNFIQFDKNNGELEKIYHWEGVQSIQMSDWRPDGTGIAYTAEIVRYIDGNPLITYAAVYSDVVLKEDKTVAYPVMLSENTLGDRGAVFSPVADKIAYWSWEADGTSAIRIYDLESEKNTKVTDGGFAFYPSWSPDGEEIIFESYTNNQRDIKIIKLSQTVD
ncbi:DPP IV N-terminal domain-containing protein [Flexistipes sinusarabici]|uniref:DPP IV N-terminal domain-containing protein n=1 Tax=Flexistipes sinusarabici TaxID=2352 RepID=UPI002356A7FB|nr:DPP IV N-terminal domain-containing protein [Flexistipes sinusarabici]